MTSPADTTLLVFDDVFFDGFIGLAQPQTVQHTLQTLLHAIDAVLQANIHPQDKPTRKQEISASKLAAGDGAWSTSKIILG